MAYRAASQPAEKIEKTGVKIAPALYLLRRNGQRLGSALGGSAEDESFLHGVAEEKQQNFGDDLGKG